MTPLDLGLLAHRKQMVNRRADKNVKGATNGPDRRSRGSLCVKIYDLAATCPSKHYKSQRRHSRRAADAGYGDGDGERCARDRKRFLRLPAVQTTIVL
ncbi:hypothetical protein EVAR_82858_1 [Eumeta japonica]|uniref:Uncharacterized protein n=1 Tax=Eumeta variegata TaxID=151549 RepID=A0A4C1V390_EUMVA|nr:hypothetical protein EVAR_82858_1 [Eumeta japonica]